MATKLGNFVLKQYEDNSAFVEFSTDDVMLRIMMFFYYIDRVIHNLSSANASKLISVMENTSAEFLVPTYSKEAKKHSIDKLLEKAHFGMHLEKADTKK